jgi:hypothetical protein
MINFYVLLCFANEKILEILMKVEVLNISVLGNIKITLIV